MKVVTAGGESIGGGPALRSQSSDNDARVTAAKID